MVRSLVMLPDLSREEFFGLLDRAGQIRRALAAGERVDTLSGRIVALLFETPSTRTRVSFEAAVLRLGGTAMYLQADRLKLGGGEPVADTARVLSGYCDAIVARVWPHETVQVLAANATVPVINALTDVDHPTQAICDLFTFRDAVGGFAGRTLAFVGTGNNMCNALLLGAGMAGLNMTVACPPGLEPDPTIVAQAAVLASQMGASIAITYDPVEAVAEADAIYTDIWEIPGREDVDIESAGIDWPRYRLDEKLIGAAPRGVKLMHCGDAVRGKEITEEAMVSPDSLIWAQADNKLFGGAAVLESFIGG